MNANDVVLTGLPRSGTTLTCEILNRVADTVALDEPMDERAWTGRPSVRATESRWVRAFRRRMRRMGVQAQPFDPANFTREVDRFFDETRRSLRTTGEAVSKNVEGEVTGGKFVDDREAETGLRKQITKRGVITVSKELSDEFVLAVKQNAGFTAALEHLVGRYRIFATVRNPLAMLSSWQTVPIPVQRGRVPRAEQVDPKLREALDRTEDVLDRQFVLLEWFYSRYKRYLPRESVITYEDLVASPAQTLAPISRNASSLTEQLESRNLAAVYDRDTMRRIGDRLLQTEGSWWEYYSPDDVRTLVEP